MNTMPEGSRMDNADLRRALGHFGTGVTVVTTRAPNGRGIGITANSFNTVSLEPPIILWSLAISSPSLEFFRTASHFAVNILTLAQVDLSRRFSRPAEDKFADIEFKEGLGGSPVLAGCAATIECVRHDQHVVGDHVLFLGQVERYSYAHEAPLLFVNGKYSQGSELLAA